MKKRLISFFIVMILLPIFVVYAAKTGSIEITFSELVKGLLTGTNENVAIIKDLR